MNNDNHGAAQSDFSGGVSAADIISGAEVQEIRALTGDAAGKSSQIDRARQFAAEEISKADPRAWDVTAFDQVRRRYEPTSDTEKWARRMVDAAAAFEGMPESEHLSDLVNEFDPATYREIKARAAAAAVAAAHGRANGGNRNA